MRIAVLVSVFLALLVVAGCGDTGFDQDSDTEVVDSSPLEGSWTIAAPEISGTIAFGEDGRVSDDSDGAFAWGELTVDQNDCIEGSMMIEIDDEQRLVTIIGRLGGGNSTMVGLATYTAEDGEEVAEVWAGTRAVDDPAYNSGDLFGLWQFNDYGEVAIDDGGLITDATEEGFLAGAFTIDQNGWVAGAMHLEAANGDRYLRYHFGGLGADGDTMAGTLASSHEAYPATGTWTADYIGIAGIN